VNGVSSVAANSPLSVSGTTAVTLSLGTVPITQGGTGNTTASAAINALLPNQASAANTFLTTNGSTASWGGGTKVIVITGNSYTFTNTNTVLVVTPSAGTTVTLYLPSSPVANTVYTVIYNMNYTINISNTAAGGTILYNNFNSGWTSTTSSLSSTNLANTTSSITIATAYNAFNSTWSWYVM